MKKKISVIIVMIVAMLCSNQVGIVQADMNSQEYTNGYNQFSERGITTFVFENYGKTGKFELYNTTNVAVYKDASSASTKIGTFAPQRWNSTQRKGNWFAVTTSKGNGWIYVNVDADKPAVELREIESINTNLKVKEDVFVYTSPFERYKTTKKLSASTYAIEKKAGDWYYVKGTGWITTEKATFPGVVTKMKIDSIPVKNRSVAVKQSIVKISEKVRPGTPLKPKYITIHNTANTATGADAKMHADYLHNQAAANNRWASWHYTVDDTEVYQSLPLNENGWHAGDGEGPGNRSSIGIEIAENRDGNYTRAQENAAYLTASLLHTFNVPYDQIAKWVVPHKSWSGKNCPAIILAQPNGFNGFLNQVRNAYNALESVFTNVKVTKVTDMKKYDAGAGNYLTYINGRGYSQYFYENNAGTYQFIPQSWLKAAGLDVTVKEDEGMKTMHITNNKIGTSSQSLLTTTYAVPKITQVNDMKKYNGGNIHLTYINGRGYSQYFYENNAQTYQFVPQSWLKAAGLTVEVKVQNGVKKLYITNPNK